MPCKHIFYCRQLQSVDLFNNELVENRWRKTIDKIDVIINENVSNDIIISDIKNFNQLTKKTNQNNNESSFSNIFRFNQQLTTSVINNNSKSKERLLVLQYISELWMQDIDVQILPLKNKLDETVTNCEISIMP